MASFSFLRARLNLVGLAGVIQLVECQLPKLDVAGSSPVARSSKVVNLRILRGARVAVRARALFLTNPGEEAIICVTRKRFLVALSPISRLRSTSSRRVFCS